LPSISMKELLEAGVHFGHQTKRWNPKMKEYIFGERNGIYIVDLQKTLKLFKDAMRYVGEMAAQGKTVLFVGTKRQAQEAIAEEATRCSQFYVNQRWLGGLLTNMLTVQRSIKRLKDLDEMANNGAYEGRAKKEAGRLERERKHLQQNLAGIKDSTGDAAGYAAFVKEFPKLNMMTGTGNNLKPALAAGMGAILADANLFPKAAADIFAAHREGKDVDDAYNRLRELNTALRPLGAGSYGPMKYALSLMMGTRQTYQRPPHLDVTDEQKAGIKAKLQELKLAA